MTRRRRQAPTTAGPPVELPIVHTGSGHLTTELAVPGGPTRVFLIDTGASGTVLDGPTLPVATRRTMRRVRGRVRGALGTADVDRRSLSSSLTSDGWTSPRLRTTVLPLSGIGAPLGLSLGGVLGLDLLARGAFAVDLDRMVLSLFPDRTAPEAAHRLHRHPIHRARRGLITLDVSVGGIIVRGVLDTGAGVSVVAPELAERAVGAAGRGPVGGGAARGIGEGRAAVWSCLLPDVRIGPLVVPALPAFVGGLDVFAPPRDGRRPPAMLIGTDLVARMRSVVVDVRRRNLYFSGTAGGEGGELR
jgi:predicted aspartyl protease